ncbi:MAG: lipopolysaccharide kinase InaA family protein [Thermodesulfobacteriota bacterium]
MRIAPRDSVTGGNAARVVRLKRGWRVTFKEKECLPGLLEKIEETLLEGVPSDWIEIPSAISSRVFRFSFMGADYVFKEYLERGALEPLKALITGVRAERAWRGGTLLVEKGFLTPPMVAWGVRKHKGMPGKSFLVTVFIRDACGLASLLKERGGALSSSETLNMRTRVSSMLGCLVGRLHSQGIVHGDLRLGNILIKGWGGDAPAFYLIDNERNACFKKIPMNLIVKNLVQVNMVLAPCVGPAVRMRFFRAYIREFPLMYANKKALAKEVSLITERRLRKKGRELVRKKSD